MVGDGLRHLADRLNDHRVRAVIESMTGARVRARRAPHDADDLRPSLLGLRPVRARLPPTPPPHHRPLAAQRQRQPGADDEPRAADRAAHRRDAPPGADHRYIPLSVTAPGVGLSRPGFRGDRVGRFLLSLRESVLNVPRGDSTMASSSWERLRQTRSAMSSVLKESTKLSAIALSRASPTDRRRPGRRGRPASGCSRCSCIGCRGRRCRRRG